MIQKFLVFLEKKRIQLFWVFSYVLIATVFYSIFGGIQKSSFALVDDHELFVFHSSFHPPKGSLTKFFPTILEKTEVGQYGKFPRYRPSYYLLRFSEVVLFGLKSPKYYQIRLCFGILFFCSIFYALARGYGFLIGFAGTIFILCDFYWADIFFRIGPAEFYCLIALNLLIFSLLLNSRSLIRYILFCIGLLILVGCKENFFPFLILGFYYIWSEYRDYKRIKFLHLLIISVPFVYSLFIISSLILNFLNAPVDIYGNSVKPIERWVRLLGIVNHVEFWIIASISFLIEYYKKEIGKPGVRLLIHFAFLNFIFNFIFYNGTWPDINRYNLPGILLYKLSIIVFVSEVLLKNARELDSLVYRITLAIVFILPLQTNIFLQTRDLLTSELEKRNRFKFNFDFINHLVDVNSDSIFVLPSHPYDHELSLSFLTQMNYYQPEAKMFLFPLDLDAQGNPLFVGLISDLQTKSETGHSVWHIEPKSELKKKYNKCFLISFRKIHKTDFSQNCASIYPLVYE